jgi:agmatinase
MALTHDGLDSGTVALAGVPCDAHSSLLRGAAAGPAAARSALFDPGSNMTTEDGVNLALDPRFIDVGDMVISDAGAEERFASIVAQAALVLERGAHLLSIGGDHAVSYPLVKAHADRHEPFAIVQVDAHPDLYDDFEGDRFSHACPFARIMENGLATSLLQVGIRAATPHQREQAERFGVEMIAPMDPAAIIERLPAGPVYLSLDLDGLDPAFVPGVSHPEAGGLSTRDVIRVIHAIPGPLIGADVVELNPRRDVGGATAVVAAKMVKEIAGRMLGG